MSVEENKREIGVMRAIGTRKRQIFGLVTYQTLIIAIIGTAIGSMCGILSTYFYLPPFQQAIPEVTNLNDLIFEIHLEFIDFLPAIAMGILIPLLFGIFPALKATRTVILDALAPYKQESHLRDQIKGKSSWKRWVLVLSVLSEINL